MKPVVLRDGSPVQIEPLSDGGSVDFGEPIGEADTIHTIHSEMRTFGSSFGCREASFRLGLKPELLATLRELTTAPEDEVERKAQEALPPSASTVSVHLVEATADGRAVRVRAVTRADGGVGDRRRRRLDGDPGVRGGAAPRPRRDLRARRAAARELRRSRGAVRRAGAPRMPGGGPGWRGSEIVKVGVPTEIKSDEYRVALTPVGARELNEHGHEVLVEKGAGEGSAIRDADYEAQGARIVPVEDVWARGRPDPRCQGAPAPGGRAAPPRGDAVHLPPPGSRTGAHQGPVRVGRDLRRLRDRGGRRTAACRSSRR